MKRALLLALLVVNLLHGSIASAQEVRTEWAPLTKSLTIEDAPGLRDGTLGRMHLAYVRDPDGNKLCAIFRVKQDR